MFVGRWTSCGTHSQMAGRFGRSMSSMTRREKCLAIEIDHSLRRPRVVRALEQILGPVRAPEAIVCDNARVHRPSPGCLAYQRGITLHSYRARQADAERLRRNLQPGSGRNVSTARWCACGCARRLKLARRLRHGTAPWTAE